MVSSILRTDKLCKSFSNGGRQQHVIKNMDLEIMENDFTIIMGASGSGKSTLLYALSGMDKPTVGKIYFGDKEIQDYSNDELAVFRRGNCGFVFQSVYLLENQTVLDNVLTGALIVQKNSPELLKKVKDLLNKVGMKEEMWNKYPNQLSGGEAQRVGIVRAIINDPKILFADEPTGGVGAVFGIFLVIFLDPMLNSIIEGMVGYHVYGSINLGIQLGIMCILVLIIVLSALGKAKTVKKYPPVVAFRKGIYTHHFRKNPLPLSGVKRNINLRLSMKDLLGNTKHSIGIMVCIFATATAILCSFYMFDYLKVGAASIMPITGLEVGDVRVELMNGVDPYEFQETMIKLPEVRKALVTYPDFMVNAKDKSANTSFFNGYAVVFDDFKETENLHLIEGCYPEHENEIMITYGRAKKEGYSIGDSIVIEGDGIENSYIITGIVNSMSNGGKNLYFTSEAFRRSFPSAKPCVVELYLNGDLDRHEFSEKLTELYGGSVEDTIKEGGSVDNYVDRVKQVADEKMAQLISLYGVTDVDYAIKIGDTLITGNSERFILRDISSTLDLADGQLKPVADGMKAVSLVIVGFSVMVATVILSVLSGTTVRRKRKELGIMKAMGYTSKDLMQQIAFRIMPIACVAVMIASVVSVYLMNAFGLTMLGVLGLHFGKVQKVLAKESYEETEQQNTSGIMGTSTKDMMLYEDNDMGYHDELLTFLAGQRLKAEPGTYAAYCNDGFALLEMIVENVSGMSYTEYLDLYIANKIGAENTGTPVNRFQLKEAVSFTNLEISHMPMIIV